MKPRFPVYSIAKPFLAQAVLELAPDLDAAIGDFLPDLAQVFACRRIGELLNHTSGLADYSALENYHEAVANHEPAWSRAKLLERCSRLDNEHRGFQYSNVGYLLLRMLVEQKTQTSMFEAIDALVLKPLQIEGCTEWETPSDLVAGYDPKWVYSGTFEASADVLTAGFRRLVEHRSRTTGLNFLAAEVPYANTGFDHPAYGLGLMMDLAPDEDLPALVGHGGGGPGFSHMIVVHPGTWQVALESRQAEFDQAAAIRRLRGRLSATR